MGSEKLILVVDSCAELPPTNRHQRNCEGGQIRWKTPITELFQVNKVQRRSKSSIICGVLFEFDFQRICSKATWKEWLVQTIHFCEFINKLKTI